MVVATNNGKGDKFTKEAKVYEDMRNQLVNIQLDHFKFVKSQIADWYIALAAVCFAIGGIAISLGHDHLAHPAFFWWGSALMIANGVFIFFVRKTEVEGESRSSNLKQREADLWTMGKIALEHADGDNSRAEEFMKVSSHFVKDYDKSSKVFKWWQWMKFIVLACLLDLVFGVFLFSILFLASQMQNYPHISFKTYICFLWSVLFIYITYVAFQVYIAIKEKKKSDNAARQIEFEVNKNRRNYDRAAHPTK